MKLVGDIVASDPQYIQFYNILARKSLEYLNLQLVGRNYFDPHAKVRVKVAQGFRKSNDLSKLKGIFGKVDLFRNHNFFLDRFTVFNFFK